MNQRTLPLPDKTASIYAIEINEGDGWEWYEPDPLRLPVFFCKQSAECTAENFLKHLNPSLQYRIREFPLLLPDETTG